MKCLCALVSGLLLVGSTAIGEVLYDISFEAPDHQVGSAPATGSGPSKVSYIIFGQPKVVNDQPLLDGNCLELEGYTSYEQIQLSTGNALGKLTLSFDVVTKNMAGSLYGFTMDLDTPEVRSVTFHGPLRKLDIFQPFGGTIGPAFVDNRKYHVTVDADTAANSWTVSVDGNKAYTAALGASSFASIRFTVSPMYGGASNNPAVKAYVDNIKVDLARDTSGIPLIRDAQAVSALATSAEFTAQVSAQTADTTVTFSYVEPRGFPSRLVQVLSANSAYVSVYAKATGLKPHTQYQYTATAVNKYGSASANGTFTTANTPPVTKGESIHTPSGSEPFTVAVKRNDYDPDRDDISVQLPRSYEENYDPNVTTDGNTVTYHPQPGFDGNVSIEYFVADAFGGRSPAWLTVSNAPPIAPSYRLPVLAGGETLPLTVSATDSDGDPVALLSVGTPAHGLVEVQDNVISYHPGPLFFGFDRFDYTVGDGHGGTATGRISVSLDQPLRRVLQLNHTPLPDRFNREWRAFGIPTLLASGTTGWLAKVDEPSGVFSGIFTGALDAPVLRLRSGAAATNRAGLRLPGTVFARFDEPVFAGDSFAFHGALTGPGAAPFNAKGIWADADGTLRLVAREGFEATGSGGYAFQDLGSIVMPAPGVVFFTGRLWNRARGLWAWQANTPMARVLCEGQVIRDEQTVAVLGRVLSFEAVSAVMGSAGHGRYDESLQSIDALVHFDNGQSAIIQVAPNGTLTAVRRSGEPDENGQVVRKFGIPSRPGGGRLPVAAVELVDTTSGRRGQAIMDFASQNVLARAGEAAPGTSSESFLQFLDPVSGLSPEGETMVAFQAKLAGAAPETNTGLWTTVSGKESNLIARMGFAAPEVPDRVFGTFKSLAMISEYGPIFTATLLPGRDCGCWATDSIGMLRLLLRTGDAIDGKTILSFDTLSTVLGSPGQRRSWVQSQDGAAVIFRVQFSDRTQGIVTVAIP